jgi:hypothetical protein
MCANLHVLKVLLEQQWILVDNMAKVDITNTHILQEQKPWLDVCIPVSLKKGRK